MMSPLGLRMFGPVFTTLYWLIFFLLHFYYPLATATKEKPAPQTHTHTNTRGPDCDDDYGALMFIWLCEFLRVVFNDMLFVVLFQFGWNNYADELTCRRRCCRFCCCCVCMYVSARRAPFYSRYLLFVTLHRSIAHIHRHHKHLQRTSHMYRIGRGRHGCVYVCEVGNKFTAVCVSDPLDAHISAGPTHVHTHSHTYWVYVCVRASASAAER